MWAVRLHTYAVGAPPGTQRGGVPGAYYTPAYYTPDGQLSMAAFNGRIARALPVGCATLGRKICVGVNSAAVVAVGKREPSARTRRTGVLETRGGWRAAYSCTVAQLCGGVCMERASGLRLAICERESVKACVRCLCAVQCGAVLHP